MSNLDLGQLAANQPAAAKTAVDTTPKRTAKPADKKGWWWGTGRRKRAVARVRIKPQDGGTITVCRTDGQTKTIEEYFTELRDRVDAVAAIKAAGLEGKLTVVVQIHGGGTMGQAQAMRMGLARALIEMDPAHHPAMREAGYLTRDAREVERKKYGQAGARRRFQFSKR
ncbi:MAG: 30S ribosomal protein S9 [Phycisphaerales bacterium]|nr:30S ribosomal protein S9 [Phycisphaerales bacterium]